MIDISGIDKAKLLAALVNEATSHLPGAHLLPPHLSKMTAEHAANWLAASLTGPHPACHHGPMHVAYVMGRPVHCDLSGDTLDSHLYDRYHGIGAAARVVAKLRG